MMRKRKAPTYKNNESEECKSISKNSLQFVLMPMRYYKLKDAVILAKSRIPRLKAEDILHHAGRGMFDLVTLVPARCNLIPENTLRNYQATPNNSPIPYPQLIALSEDDCIKIELCGEVNQSSFGYGYYRTHGEFFRTNDKRELNWKIADRDLRLPSNPSKDAAAGWNTGDTKVGSIDKTNESHADYKKTNLGNDHENERLANNSIRLTTDNILIRGNHLYRLVKSIELELEQIEARSKPQRLLQELTGQNNGNDSDKQYHSLADEVSKAQKCSSLSLLRRAIQRNIPLQAMVPEGVNMSSSDVLNDESAFQFLYKPQLLTLKKEDCEKIFYEKQIELSDFYQGYLVDDSGRLKRVTPIEQCPRGLPVSTNWRTFKGGEVRQIKLCSDDLFVLHSDLSRLTSSALPQADLRYPESSRQLITNGYLSSLEDAVEILKIKHPDCTLEQVLHFTKINSVDILTPVPIELEIRYVSHDKKLSPRIDPNPPQFLTICEGHRESLMINGAAVTTNFSDGLTISSDRITKICSEWNADIKNEFYRWYAVTLCEGMPYQIELRPDNLFIFRSELFKILITEDDQWKLGIEDLERKLKNLRDLQTDIHGSDTKRTESREVSPGTSLLHSDKKITPETSVATGQLIGALEVQRRLGIGRTSLFAMSNSASVNYNKDFPSPITPKGKKRRWKEVEIDAYIKRSGK